MAPLFNMWKEIAVKVYRVAFAQLKADPSAKTWLGIDGDVDKELHDVADLVGLSLADNCDESRIEKILDRTCSLGNDEVCAQEARRRFTRAMFDLATTTRNEQLEPMATTLRLDHGRRRARLWPRPRYMALIMDDEDPMALEVPDVNFPPLDTSGTENTQKRQDIEPCADSIEDIKARARQHEEEDREISRRFQEVMAPNEGPSSQVSAEDTGRQTPGESFSLPTRGRSPSRWVTPARSRSRSRSRSIASSRSAPSMIDSDLAFPLPTRARWRSRSIMPATPRPRSNSVASSASTPDLTDYSDVELGEYCNASR